jgi:hypothetical protein
VRAAASLLTTGLLIAGCAHKPLPAPAAAIAPDPFGYQPRSAVCTVSPVVAGPAGRSVTMSVRSDDGLCAVAVSQPDGTAYASFLLQALPEHGKAFIHNYNNQTLIDYTATTAYAGPDSFTVSLIPGDGGTRTVLHVVATVDATGVARPAAVVPYAAPPTGSSGHKATTRSHARKKKTTSSRS